MKRFTLPAILLATLLFGCGAAQQSAPEATPSVSGDANVFNPFLQSQLPNTRAASGEGDAMLGAMGGKRQSIEEEAKHRKYWRQEIYPIVFGQTTATQEILVVLDFANPASEKVWQEVVAASRDISPAKCKIAVFGRSSETYGTDLMGMTIWLSHQRPGQAMPWLTYALGRWNAAKQAQHQAGRVKKFANEYDAVASPQDLPIPFGFHARITPPIPASQELAIAKYCYDAGNVNMFQANQICQYYGISSLPAVVVNGKPLAKISTASILAALR